MEEKILVVKHEGDKGPGLMVDVFMAEGWSLSTVDLASGERLPGSLEDVAGVVSLGRLMNVYDEGLYPFLKDEDKLIRKALVEEIPFLGICLGAQLLAKTCGAQVKPAAAKEIGWHSIELTEEGKRDPLFYGTPEGLTVFEWHEDTFEIPEGGVLLATGEKDTNQAFRVGKNAYGVQFHIEVTPPMIKGWTANHAKHDAMPGMQGGMDEIYDTFREKATRLLSNFQRIMESSLQIRRIMKMFKEERKVARIHARACRKGNFSP